MHLGLEQKYYVNKGKAIDIQGVIQKLQEIYGVGGD